MARKEITVKDAVVAGPYSPGIDADGFIFLSGQAATDPATGTLIEGDISKQTEQVFKNLFNVLAAAGLTPDAVQKVNVYLIDMNDFSAMNEVYKNQFAKPYPTRTTVAVSALPMGARVEIELIAKR